MTCIRCGKEIPEGSKYCNLCGAKQIRERSVKSRSNGSGTVFKDSNGKWTAQYTIGWDEKDGKLLRKRRKKTGFSTKREALEHLPLLKQELPQHDPKIKFKDMYNKWLEIHSEKVSKSTLDCYKSAYKYYAPLYYSEVAKIRTEHLQLCIDECPHGKRTKQNMKVLGTCLFKYAMQHDIVDKNYAEFLYIKKEEKTERTAFSAQQLQTMWENLNTVPEAKYILILCYTGMRLGEMLSAETAKYHPRDGYFITGSKTEAGKDRIITISPKIMPFFTDFGKGKYLFFSGDKKFSEKDFRSKIFYHTLNVLGMNDVNSNGTHKLSPHCCRHTFATLMKNVDAPNTDKQKLIGHSSFEMTAHYTHTDIDSLKKITDNI